MAVNINVPSQVKTYANLAAFPASGALKTIYIAEDTNKTYRWTGSVYTEISATAASTWGAIGGTLSNQTDLQTALNAKQNSLGYTPVPETRTLTINGTTQDLSADRTFTISTGITIGTTAITSGTVGRVLFEGTGNVVQESANLTWDNTNGIFNVVGRINAKSTTAQPSSLIVEGTTGVNSGNAGFVVRTGTGYQATFFAADSLAGQGIAGLGIFSGSATPFGLQTGAPNGAFFIHNNGNIGIGTSYTNAGFRLDVNGTARVQGNAQFGTGFYWDNTNNRLGIGTSSPSRILEIAGSAPVVRISGNTVTFAGIQMTNNGGDFWVGRDNSGGSSFGLNSPAYSGVINARGSYPLLLGAADKTAIYVFPTTTNVHIGAGTTIPTDAGFRLDVNGTARVQGELTVNGVQIGLGGGAVTSNTRVGTNALNANTTGSNNTAVGVQANRLNTTGSFNGAFGLNALGSNTASLNDAFGFFSAYSNTTGGLNSAFGAQSLEKNTTGSNNIAMGFNSGRYITDGVTANAITNNSIFLGVDSKALANNQTNQIVIGHNAIGAGSNTVTLGNTSITKTILRGTLNAANLPTSSAGLSAGDIWNDAGTLKIV